jgi:radical SAM superfamily enzyme YgiQ (UPF0313 family)
MTKILLINPNKWGRGITHIWIASHVSSLSSDHEVELFDCTFYKNWTVDEVGFATGTAMFKESDYKNYVKFRDEDVLVSLQKKVDQFKPDIIFWSAISSHIHSEGEYVNIQNGYDLLKNININGALKITGGLQATSDPKIVFQKLPNIDFLIMGESELVLKEIADKIDSSDNIKDIKGLSFIKDNKVIINPRQNIISSLDTFSPYNYDIFDDQVFYRPYNGEVVRAVDYELSRGCIYSCSYCVETVIQKYYGFEDSSSKTGAIKNFKSYLRNKSADVIFDEISYLVKKKKINFIRCQDTNFLTNDRKILIKLANKIKKSNLDFRIYIETRPEGINDLSVELLKDLKVDGVGMGVELAAEDFREESLNRFASQEKTILAFEILKKNGIKRTTYNVIGFPDQTEESILQTIEFNKLLNPDNITVAYYSPYVGTGQQKKGVDTETFSNYEFDADAALRSKSKSKNLSTKKLDYYKQNFVKLARS